MRTVTARPVTARPVTAPGWFLAPAERDNDATVLDRRHADGCAYTTGNTVRALVHGAEYFAHLLAAIDGTRAGDLLLFTDWRGDPDERMAGPGTEISTVLAAAARRGVIVKGLIWRSHLDKLNFSEAANRHLGEEIEAAGGECLLDMRVRTGGSHHQKMVVLRHPGRPHRDVGYVGGIDLCHSRADDAEHHGDAQPQPIAPRYGRRPPWHDMQLEVRGPAVADLEAVFRERWCDPAPLSRNPMHRLRDLVQRTDTVADPLPAQLPDPAPEGGHAVQVLRTYPYRRRGYPFAPRGERSVARGYAKALRNAQSLIYLEDQYLWSEQVVSLFAAALATQPELLLIAVLPLHPDQDGTAGAAQRYGRDRAVALLHQAGGDRVAVYGLENHAGVPVYVHGKLCVVDDQWSCVGSDNINLRSWTHDSELSCAVQDQDGGTGFGRGLRLQLHREHLDRADGDDTDLREPRDVFAAYARAADGLDEWYRAGTGPRPAGRLRRYQPQPMPTWQRLLARPIYRWLCDPDGRPRALRRARQF